MRYLVFALKIGIKKTSGLFGSYHPVIQSATIALHFFYTGQQQYLSFLKQQVDKNRYIKTGT
jgi:hypothetical protein